MNKQVIIKEFYKSSPIFIIAALIFWIDQYSKYLVWYFLAPNGKIPKDAIIQIIYSKNTGMAFGLLVDQTLFLTIASCIGIIILSVMYYRFGINHWMLKLSFGLQLGGALGNLIDRIRLGYVVDFIKVGLFPVFNIADSSVVVGVILLGFVILFTNYKSNTKDKSNILSAESQEEIYKDDN